MFIPFIFTYYFMFIVWTSVNGCKFDDPFICLLILEVYTITPTAGKDEVAGVVSPEMAKKSRVCTDICCTYACIITIKTANTLAYQKMLY